MSGIARSHPYTTVGRFHLSNLPRTLLDSIRHVPWVPDVLFGAILFSWGLAEFINPSGSTQQSAWKAISHETLGTSIICVVFGLNQFVAGFLRIEQWRQVAAMLAGWGFAFLTAATGTQTGHIAYGGYVVGEMLICLKLL